MTPEQSNERISAQAHQIAVLHLALTQAEGVMGAGIVDSNTYAKALSTVRAALVFGEPDATHRAAKIRALCHAFSPELDAIGLAHAIVAILDAP